MSCSPPRNYNFKSNQVIDNPEMKFSPLQVRSDLDSLVAVLERIHPDIYHISPKELIDSLIIEAGNSTNEPISGIEFWKLAQKIVARVGDGHTSLSLPYEYRQSYLDHGGGIFPFNVRIEDDQLFVRENFSSDSTIGIDSEILMINNLEISNILSDMRELTSGERIEFINTLVAWQFKPLLWALYGWGDSFQIDLESPGGIGKTISQDGVSLEDYSKRGKTSSNPIAAYSYVKIEDDKIGYLDFRQMIDVGGFDKFIDSVFTSMDEDNVSSLIIDLRKNGGGDSRLIESLFSYFTTEPYAQVSEMWIKVSPEARSKVKAQSIRWYTYPLLPLAYFIPSARAILFGDMGDLVKISNDVKSHKKKEPFFTGDVYLLTSANTFSSASLLAGVFKCVEMGTIIGEETGGLTVTFGDIVPFSLPITKMAGTCSYKKFVFPCGKDDGRGVIPDFEVKQNADDTANGVDTVLKHAVQK